MASNIRSFDFSLGRYDTRIEALKRRRMTAVALEATKGVIMLTPVDRGRMKGNWQVTIGSPAQGEIDRELRTPVGSVGNAPQLNEVLSLMRRWRGGEFFWLHNGVPYAIYVEQGTERTPAFHPLLRTVERLRSWLGQAA